MVEPIRVEGSNKYCKWCKHCKDISSIHYENGEEYIKAVETCTKYPGKEIEQYDEWSCYESEEE